MSQPSTPPAPASDDETQRVTPAVANLQPLQRALSFPFEITYDEVRELAEEVLRQSQSQSLEPSLEIFSVPDASEDSEDPTSLLAKRQRFDEAAAAISEPNQKQRRILTRARAARYTHLSDLINSGILEVGEALTLKGQRGVVNREGWIEYGDNMYPGAWTWCNAIKNNTDVSMSIPLDDLNTQTEEQLAWDSTVVEGRNAALAEYQQLYEKETEFRHKLQAHRRKLLERRRRQQRQRERAHQGLPPSQEDEFGEMLPPSPDPLYRSRLDSQSVDDMMDEGDLEEDYEPAPRRKASPKKKKSPSPKKAPRNRPQLPQPDFTSWTASGRQQGEAPPVKVTTTDTRVVEMEAPPPQELPESEEFFAPPPMPEASDSLNSLVSNLMHLAEGSELPESEPLESEPEPQQVRAGPNRLVDEDEEPTPVVFDQQSQEWIQRRTPVSSPAARATPPNRAPEVIAIPDSMETDLVGLVDSEEVLLEDSHPAPPSPEVQAPPSPQPSPPASPASAPAPVATPTPPMSASPSPVSSQPSSSKSSSATSTPSVSQSSAASRTTLETQTLGQEVAGQSSSAPEKPREQAYEDHEVFLAPSQPSPVDHQRSPERQRLEQPLSSLSEQWRKRKAYQRQMRPKSPPAGPPSASLSQLEDDDQMQMMDVDPPTSQTVPYVSQASLQSPSASQAVQFKTLAEQWDERKAATRARSPSPLPSPTGAGPTVEEELQQLEDLEQQEARKEAAHKRLQQSRRAHAAQQEKEKEEKLAEQQRQLQAKLQQERQEQDRKVQARQAADLRKAEALAQQQQQARAAEVAKAAQVEKEKLAHAQHEAERLATAEALAKQQALEALEEERVRAAEAARVAQLEQETQARAQEEAARQEEKQRLAEEKRVAEKEKQRQAEKEAAEEEERRIHAKRARHLALRKEQAAFAHRQQQERQARRREKEEAEAAALAAAAPATPPGSPLVLGEIESVVAYCRQKQAEMENVLTSRTASADSIETELRQQREQQRRVQEEEQQERETELSQKLDEILSVASSCDSMEVDSEHAPSQAAAAPTKYETAPPAVSARASSWHHPSQRQSLGSISSMDSDHVSESPVVAPFARSTVVPAPGAGQPVILASGLSSRMLERIHMLVQELGGQLVHQWSDQVSHLVVLTSSSAPRETRRTLKYNQAVLAGRWVVNYDWILESFHRQSWVDELAHQIAGDDTCAENIPAQARVARSKGQKRLFHGLSFYLCGEFQGIQSKALRQLIAAGHGKVFSALPRMPKTTREELENTNKASRWVAVCDGSAFDYEAAKKVYFSSGLQPVSYEYLFDCVSHYELLSRSRYQILETTQETFQTQHSQAF